MNWMKNVDSTVSGKKYYQDSTGMGWYDGVSGNSEHKTGIDLNGGKNQVKKVYDLAGNVSEWTMESYYTENRVNRGGVYYGTASYSPASRRNYKNPFISGGEVGFRPTLFLKS